MDGVPMSNNGTLSQGGFSSTAFVGTDLRQISADDIESVEIIRGIPSAEYGDYLRTCSCSFQNRTNSLADQGKDKSRNNELLAR